MCYATLFFYQWLTRVCLYTIIVSCVVF